MWLAVSPSYRKTGLVLASINVPACSADCLRLLASHDGGATWTVQPAIGWGGGRFSIASSGDGRDVVFGEAGSGVQRSDDDGATWRQVGAAGSPTPSPIFGRDATVAVASTSAGAADYVMRGASTSPAAGSGGVLVDFGFMLSPSFPAGGRYAPALLSAADANTQSPLVEQCDDHLACTGATALAGAGPWANPVMLFPSSTYAADGTVFAKAGRAVYKSTSGGRAFTPLAILPDHNGSVTAYPMLALAPSYSELASTRTLYVAALQVVIDKADPSRSRSSGGVLRSTDGGATWSRVGVPNPLDTGASAVAVAPDGRLFAGYLGGPQGSAGLLCSADASTWAPACPPFTVADASVKTSGGSPGRTAPSTPACRGGCGHGVAQVGVAPDVDVVGNAPGPRGNVVAPAVRSAGRGTLVLLVIVILAITAAGATWVVVQRRWTPSSPGRRGRQLCVPAPRPAPGMSRHGTRHHRSKKHETEVGSHEQHSSG